MADALERQAMPSAPPPQTSPHRASRTWVPSVVLAVALSLTLVSALLVHWSARGRDLARFGAAVARMENQVLVRFETYHDVLRGAEGLIAAFGPPSDEAFRAYLRPLELREQYPGIQGVGWTVRVPAERLEAFEARIREQNPRFRVWPERARDEYHAIVLLEPLDRRNQAAIGYDMFTEATRREAMSQARDRGTAALSGKVTLVQEIDEDKQAGFLLYLPVYEGSETPETLEARRNRLLGFVYAPFRARDFFRGIFSQGTLPDVGLEVYDGDLRTPDAQLHRETGLSAHEEARVLREDRPSFEDWRTLTIAGRVWTLRIFTLPTFDEGSWQGFVPWVLLLGFVISAVLFGLSRAQARTAAVAASRAEDLRIALDEISESNRRKDEFLAMLAHELRNPLAPVLTAVQLMARKLAKGVDVTRERTVLERQIRHMIRLVDDLLDVSRITRGKVVLQKKPISLAASLANSVDVVRPMADQKKHSLTVTVPHEPVWVLADPVRMEQILNNLLTNAAKYTPNGGDLRASLSVEGEQAVVRVKDTGVGIPKEAQGAIFELFVQGARGLDRTGGGLGIGLTLVKRLVELHEGTIQVFSDGPGKGSEFTLKLPLGQAPTNGLPPPSSEPLQRPLGPTRVLVVDDNIDAAEALVDFLGDEGANVQMAHSGPDALQKVASFLPSVVLLDIGLPGMDGYEVARRIRAHAEWGRIRLIALTGYGQKSDVERSLEAGFDLHLVKPVELSTLRNVLDQQPG